jgi:uncharacterized delta-60 repeat protein
VGHAANLGRGTGVTPTDKPNAVRVKEIVMLGRKLVGTLAAIAGTLAILLACAGTASASARFDDRPVRFWSFSEIRQGVGKVRVAGGSQQGGLLHKHRIFGSAGFNFPESQPRDRASGDVFSTASGKRYAVLAQAPTFNPFQAGSKKGALTHLDELQAYQKRSDKASLGITLSSTVLDAIDANHGLLPSECPSGRDCTPIRGIVRFHARAYAESAGGDFFSVGGVAYIEGHEGRWTIEAATSSDSRRPLWSSKLFSEDDDVGDTGTRSHATAELRQPLKLNVPLSSVRKGELFAVHVSLDAEAIDSRGRESAVEAFIKDPQQLKPALLKTRGLRARGAPKFREPRVKGPAAARCPAGPHRKAGRLQLSAPAYVTDESTGVPMFVLVTRTGGKRGKASARVTTRAGSAGAGRDYRKTSTTVSFRDGDASPRLVEVPILEDQEAEGEQTLSVSLSRARCAKLGTQRGAQVTIVDDDSPPARPPPSFTIGGTVNGLQGSGLVLHDLGSDLAIAGNGPFALPGTRADGLPYDIGVRTQPSNPDQVCSVSHGAGTIHGADVSDIAVDCVTPALPSRLDPTFGGDGRVSPPVGAGKGEAVLLQPDGAIITAGRRSTGGGIDFALTRHDATGRLDTGFGTGGIVTTDLGSQTDEAFDAAPHPDGGFVVVGRTDGPGVFNRNVGVVRYKDDGGLDTGFGGDGIVTTDFAGEGDEANAVAVQPDGKIVVAGLSTTGGLVNPDADFALARYNTDGSLDASFGGDGKVTTDLGAETDVGRAVVIQNGKIVVAGTSDSDVALARYTQDGELDTSFGRSGSGITITDFGSDNFATGVALTAAGQILVAGHTLGGALNTDFALARYDAGGGLDTSFGSGGIVKTDLGPGDDFAENLAVQADGRIVVVGRATRATILDMALVRYRADGTLDTGFDGDGILTADFHGKGEFGQDVALQADGKIVAAGYTANGVDTEFALMRANP